MLILDICIQDPVWEGKTMELNWFLQKKTQET